MSAFIWRRDRQYNLNARLLDQLVRNAGRGDSGVAQQSRGLQRHTDFVQGDDVRPQTGYLSADQRMPVAPALMILFQIERHDSELHRPCSAAPEDPAMLRTIPLS